MAVINVGDRVEAVAEGLEDFGNYEVIPVGTLGTVDRIEYDDDFGDAIIYVVFDSHSYQYDEEIVNEPSGAFPCVRCEIEPVND